MDGEAGPKCNMFSFTDEPFGDIEVDKGDDALILEMEGSRCMCEDNLLFTPSLWNAGSDGWDRGIFC